MPYATRTPIRPALLCLALLLVLPACLESMGEQEVVTEQASTYKDQLADDSIGDKSPVFDPDMRVVDRFGEARMTLNKSGAVIKLDIGDMDDPPHSELEDVIFPTYGAALRAVSGPAIPSLEVVHNKLKSFNDAFYAGVEVGVFEGVAEVFNGKVALYTRLMDAVVAARSSAASSEESFYTEAAARLAASLLVAGITPDAPGDVVAMAGQLVSEFDDLVLLSKPIGFYTWNETLEAVFRMDRFHQQWVFGPDLSLYGQHPPSFRSLLVMAQVIQQEPALQADYETVLGTYEGMTNPYSSYSVADLFELTSVGLPDVGSAQSAFNASHPPIYESGGQLYAPIALVPSSTSPETRLFNRIFPDGVPADVEIMDALIGAIMSGEIDLAPMEASGWYDYQLYALETLLLPERAPESAKLLLTKAYKEKLIESFKTMLTQTRETHVKQLSFGAEFSSAQMEPIEVDVYPVLHAEPFPTYYLRQARSYRFVKTVVGAALGQAFIDQAVLVGEDGATQVTIAAGLDDTARLAYGLYYLTMADVGMHPEVLAEEAEEFPRKDCEHVALRWLYGASAVGTSPNGEAVTPDHIERAWGSDPETAADPRVIVPVQYDGDGNAVYWAVIGVKAIRIRAEFVEGFEPEIVGCEMADEWQHCTYREFVPYEPYIMMGKQVEVRIPASAAPPTREEFRALCDQHQSEEAIIKALEGWR